MPGKAARIEVTERQFELLEQIVASRTASVRLVQRAKIVLLAFKRLNNEEIAEQVDLNPQQVSVWRKRWRDNWQRLILIECSESLRELKKQIEQLLADRPRSGKASRFTPEQQAAIVSIACENPDADSERPISQFTAREVADEAIERGIVDSISVSRVQTFLKSGRRSTASKQVLAVSQNRRP